MVMQSEARLRESMAAADADASKVQDEESYVDAAGSGSTADLLGAPTTATEFNGEGVREAMESWRVAEMVRGGLSGLAFALAVVGIWGDGTTVRQAVMAGA